MDNPDTKAIFSMGSPMFFASLTRNSSVKILNFVGSRRKCAFLMPFLRDKGLKGKKSFYSKSLIKFLITFVFG